MTKVAGRAGHGPADVGEIDVTRFVTSVLCLALLILTTPAQAGVVGCWESKVDGRACVLDHGGSILDMVHEYLRWLMALVGG